MIRKNGRKPQELRSVRITKNYLKTAQSSCLIEFGDTQVICAATLEENVPVFLKNTATGWLTAEYGMLPCSCHNRVLRNKISGRTHEIQRLIGRSLRSGIDLERIGERTIRVDCDVLQADGGTRTAAITGSFVVVADILKNIKTYDINKELLVKDLVAAVSVGIKDGQLLLDLDYEEDSSADMDMNIVMRGCGDFVEIQATAEGLPFSRNDMNQALDLAKKGIEELFCFQRQAIEA